MLKVTALIHARSGSKGIKDKNLSKIGNKTLLEWSINACKRCSSISEVIISTDSEKCANHASEKGGLVPFLRPKNISDDFTDTRSVVAHTIDWMINKNLKPKAVCCIYATAPFIKPQDLVRGYKALLIGKWKYVFSASYFPFSIFRSFKKYKNSIKMFFPNKFGARSQDLPANFHDAGMFYWAKPKQWLKKEKIFNKKSFALLIDRLRVNDIDTLKDWKVSELIAKIYLKK